MDIYKKKKDDDFSNRGRKKRKKKEVALEYQKRMGQHSAYINLQFTTESTLPNLQREVVVMHLTLCMKKCAHAAGNEGVCPPIDLTHLRIGSPSEFP